MARKKPFEGDYENVFIPMGKRVKALQVISDMGRGEYVQITVEDEPVLPPEVLAEVTVNRE